MSKRARNRWLIVGGIVVVAVALGGPAWLRARELSQRLVCGSRLKGYGTCCKMYADLVPKDAADPLAVAGSFTLWLDEQTTCPVSGRKYHINPAIFRGIPEEHISRTIVAYEDLANHGDGGNVLYGDGHATFERAEELERLLREQGLER